MPVDTNTIKLKLAQLEEYIADVKKLRNKPETEFVERSDTEILAERHIEKACQAALDIANHIIAEQGLGVPTRYGELGYILARTKIIPDDLAKRMEEIAKFRNRLVHEYATLSPKIIYQIVSRDIDDLKEFAFHIFHYLESVSG